ncbi:MAG: hypothetical protein M0R32_08410 [Candidatus Cloacimonetes bacterium]|jgi:hypothetical protein|nr:hypothetical protein [Candidatus Cloacimonadota bacterium]
MKTHKVVRILSSDRKTILQMKESTYQKIIDALTKDKLEAETPRGELWDSKHQTVKNPDGTKWVQYP